MTKRLTYSIFAVLTLTYVLTGQDGTFTASVSEAKVAAGQQFEVSFTVSGGDVNGVRNLRPPDFGQFVVLSGPSQATNMQWINGRSSASVAYTYILYARQPGKYTIGSAGVEYKGATLKTQPIQIEIVQGKLQTQAQQNAQLDVASIGDNVFIKAIQDKQRVKQGEQLTVTYKLYTRVSVSGYDLAKAPTFEGFWGEDFEQPRQPVLTTETVNGKQYRVAVVKKTALFATQAGNLKIAPLEVRCAVQLQSRRKGNDPFDSFFNDPFFQQVQTVNYDFKSNPLTIVVDPIPANAPAGFTGAIGQFSFSATVDRREVKAGDPITLRLGVSGSGNVKLLSIPRPALPADVEAYEPKISEEITRDAGIIRGKKIAEYLLIPRNAGQRVIESIPFTYYNLEQKQYATIRSPKFELIILPGKDLLAGASIASKEDVRMLGEDIRFLKLSTGELRRVDESPFSSGWFVVAVILPPLLFIGAWGYRRRLEKIYGDMPRLLFEKAGREATKRLRHAKHLLAKGDAVSYNAEILKALVGYLEHKLRIPKASLSMEDVLSRLRERRVADEAIQKMKSCVERAEFARYAPAADTETSRKDLLDAAAVAIDEIERSFNGRGRA